MDERSIDNVFRGKIAKENRTLRSWNRSRVRETFQKSTMLRNIVIVSLSRKQNYHGTCFRWKAIECSLMVEIRTTVSIYFTLRPLHWNLQVAPSFTSRSSSFYPGKIISFWRKRWALFRQKWRVKERRNRVEAPLMIKFLCLYNVL